MIKKLVAAIICILLLAFTGVAACASTTGSEPKQIKIASFNIEVGYKSRTLSWSDKLRGIAREIIDQDLDILGMQEVTIYDLRDEVKNGNSWYGDGRITLEKLLEEETGEEWYFHFVKASEANTYDAENPSAWGNMIVSRYPFSETGGAVYDVDANLVGATERTRGYAYAKIDLGDGYTIDFYCTHLYQEQIDGANLRREYELKQLAAAVSKSKKYIITGDFNIRTNTEAGEREWLSFIDKQPEAIMANYTRSVDYADGELLLTSGGGNALDNIIAKGVSFSDGSRYMHASGMSDHKTLIIGALIPR